jgi:two-component system, LuxR family, response regulator FixJ
MSDKVTVHIVDDDLAMREALAFLLDVNGFESKTYESADAFVSNAAVGERSCVISDIRMPGLNGLELLRQLKSKQSSCPVVLMTGHGDVALAVEAMKAGAADFIEKPFDDAVLLEAIGAALQSHSSAQGDSTARKEAEARLAELSPREGDVLRGLVAGKINKVIAYELSISPRTVEVYRANLMAKTGARSISDLMRLALAAGL